MVRFNGTKLSRIDTTYKANISFRTRRNEVKLCGFVKGVRVVNEYSPAATRSSEGEMATEIAALSKRAIKASGVRVWPT